jgi:hypothetical protein
MTRIQVAVRIPAPVTVVWADLRHIDRHVEWMHDAIAIDFLTSQTEGVGTTFDCPTRVGPLRLTDRMEITSWIEGAEMGVRHVGLVTGEGRFTLAVAGGDETDFSWTETLAFPWWLGGRVGELVGGPILKLIWRRNLRALAERFGPA